jgi:chorismate dehydratase
LGPDPQSRLLYWVRSKRRETLHPLRISIVEYLNTTPLVRGFTHGPLRGKYDLSFTVPSKCAAALRTGAADIAIIPAIEYQRIENLALLPGLSIASKKSVRSLLLISQKPIREVRRVALDKSSRSTQSLTRILCSKRWNISPEFSEAEPNLPEMLQQADAALLIGDPALRVSLDAENSARRTASGDLACAGASVGLDSISNLFVYDIVEKWRAMTSLPAVLAVWAARRGTVTPEIARDFHDSLAFGMQHLDDICGEASTNMGLPSTKLRRYLTENIDYGLDAENLQGLQRYFDLAAELGLIAKANEIEFVDMGAAVPAPELASPRTT